MKNKETEFISTEGNPETEFYQAPLYKSYYMWAWIIGFGDK